MRSGPKCNDFRAKMQRDILQRANLQRVFLCVPGQPATTSGPNCNDFQQGVSLMELGGIITTVSRVVGGLGFRILHLVRRIKGFVKVA